MHLKITHHTETQTLKILILVSLLVWESSFHLSRFILNVMELTPARSQNYTLWSPLGPAKIAEERFRNHAKSSQCLFQNLWSWRAALQPRCPAARAAQTFRTHESWSNSLILFADQGSNFTPWVLRLWSSCSTYICVYMYIVCMYGCI